MQKVAFQLSIDLFVKFKQVSRMASLLHAILIALAIASFAELSANAERKYFENEVGAWHLHTFLFEVKESSVDEALSFRRKLREMINDGRLAECSLNQIFIGWYGPFPVSQFEMCCNSTSFNAAHSFMAQNHGNLSIFVHPLTIFDWIDHTERSSWLGEPVIIDRECPCWYPELPKPKPCPVYPEYPDELPTSMEDYQIPLPGTEDYWHLNKDFDILKDPY